MDALAVISQVSKQYYFAAARNLRLKLFDLAIFTAGNHLESD